MAPVTAPAQNSTGSGASVFLDTGSPHAPQRNANAGKIAALEKRQDELENLVRSIALEQKKEQKEREKLARSIDTRLKKLGA